MKKLTAVFLVCSFCAVLTACDPSNYFFSYEDTVANVAAVELINYDNNNPKYYNGFFFTHPKSVISFDFDKVEIIETLNEESIDNFSQELSQIHFLQYWNHYDSAVGISIRLRYSNGSFDIISCNQYNGKYYNFVGQYDREGKPIKFIGGFASRNDFVNIINNHFQTQIE